MNKLQIVKVLKCCRCGENIHKDSRDWAYNFHNGYISIDRSSSLVQFYQDTCGEKISSHEAIKSIDGQNLKIEYGYRKDYKLCCKCNDEIISFLAKFFGGHAKFMNRKGYMTGDVVNFRNNLNPDTVFKIIEFIGDNSAKLEARGCFPEMIVKLDDLILAHDDSIKHSGIK